MTSSARQRFRDRPRVRTGLSILPSLFTIGNMFAGYYSVVSTLRGNYDYAAIAIGVGAVLDVLDGRIARMTDTSSDFGVELDSLADILTFGVAPSIMALHWGTGGMAGISVETTQDIYKLGWLATFIFLIAGALRLARFNVLARKPADTDTKGFFVGLPIPAAAGVVAAVVHFVKTPITDPVPALAWCALVAVLGLLMVSTIRYPSFKNIDLRRPMPRAALIATATLIGLIVFFSEIVLLLIALLYMASGPSLRVSTVLRRRVSQEPPRLDSPGDAS